MADSENLIARPLGLTPHCQCVNLASALRHERSPRQTFSDPHPRTARRITRGAAGQIGGQGEACDRVYRVPSSMILSPLPKLEEKKTDSGAKPKELPVTADGEMRYDVWSFLEASGVEKSPGSEAILLKDSNALVVKCSAEMQDLVERILSYRDCGIVVKSVETTVSLWEYEDDQFADVISGLHTFAELRQRAAIR